MGFTTSMSTMMKSIRSRPRHRPRAALALYVFGPLRLFSHRARHAVGDFPVSLRTRHVCGPALRRIFVADKLDGSCDPERVLMERT